MAELHPDTIAAMQRLATTPPTSDQAMSNSETRRLTVVLTVAEVERLRQYLQPDESMADLLRRVLQEVGR
jgi:hypothetical protein